MRDTVTLDGLQDGVFAQVSFDLTIGEDRYVAAPGRRLELRDATLDGSSNDSWIADDSADAPTRLVITPPSGSSGGGGALMPDGPYSRRSCLPVVLVPVAVAAVVTARQPGRSAPLGPVGRLAVPTGG